MKPCTTAVQTLLDGWTPLSSITYVDLYTITLITGEVFRFTSSQRAISAPEPETSTPFFDFIKGPGINRTRTKTQVGVEVDILDVEFLSTENDLITNGGTLSWQQALRTGLFDNATVEVWRCLISAPRTVVGTIVWFHGRVGDVEIGRTKNVLKVRSLLDLLKIQMPKRIFQSSCTFVFGDTQCGFDPDVDGAAGPGGGGPSYAQDVTADVGSVQSQIVVLGGLTPSPATLFNQGTIIGLTGANTGYKRTIYQFASDTAYVLQPWIFPVVVGDTFRIRPGCPHTLDACMNTFSNLLSDGSARDGGYPYIPPPETAV